MRLPERLPSRLPVILFAVLALATIGAFYLTQHLKVANPLINGDPRVDPAFINPRSGGICTDAAGDRVSFRHTRVGFYLQSKSDVVYVDVFNADGETVAQMSGSGRYVRAANNNYVFFGWNGQTSGHRYAPAGTYTLRVYLKHEDRNVPISGQTITVDYAKPVPRVTGVTVSASGTATGTTTQATTTGTSPGTTSTTATSTTATTSPATSTTAGTSPATSTTATTSTTAGTSGVATATATTPAFTPGPQMATIHYRGGNGLGADVLVYRASAAGTLKLVQTFGIDSHQSTANWNGMINGHPAPAGSYLIGVSVLNDACTQGQFPLVDDPAPGSTIGAGVNVAYLDATPPLEPVPAGHLASVAVQSGGAAYDWELRRAGAAKVIFHGSDSGSGPLRVRLPDIGLYDLSLSSGGDTTSVPLVASGVGPRASAPVLVVLPALSWQGDNAVDGNGDGLIDTLSDGGTVNLARPLVDGLPSDVANEAALLDTLDDDHLDYDLTTDVALAEGAGPSLQGRSGVLLDGTFTWLPTQIYNPLRAFVQSGGGAFAAGVNSLQSTASISGFGANAVAGPAQGMGQDPFEVKHGAVSPTDGQIIAEFTDGLGLFSTAAALQYPSYQVLQPPGDRVATAAGVSQAAPAIIGFHLGKGTVAEAGLPDFGSSLAGDVDAQELLSRIWRVVLR